MTNDWYAKAVCKGVDVNIFYQEIAGGDMKYVEARSMCLMCPVKQQCKDSAIAEEAMCGQGPFGMRAGLLPRERARMIKKRKAQLRVRFLEAS